LFHNFKSKNSKTLIFEIFFSFQPFLPSFQKKIKIFVFSRALYFVFPLYISGIISHLGSCLGLHLEELQHEELQHGVLHLGGDYTVFPAILENKVISSYLWTYDLYSPVGNAFDAGKSIMTFSGPIWHSPNGSMPFHRAQKSLDFQGLNPSHLPK
jgi:hypothetical protein